MQETLTVRLKNYVLLSPEAINLDDANRQKLQQLKLALRLTVSKSLISRIFLYNIFRGERAGSSVELLASSH